MVPRNSTGRWRWIPWLVLWASCEARTPTARNDPAEPDTAPTPAPTAILDPAAAASHLEAARTHLDEGRMDEAFAAFASASAADPTDRTIAREYATLLCANLLQADPGRALEVLDRAFGEEDGGPDLEMLRTRAAYRAHDRTAALRATSLADRADASPALRGDAHHILGLLAEERGEFEVAALEYRAAVAAVPASALFRCRLGNALDELGDAQSAIESLQQAVRLDPGLAEAHFRLAHLYRRAGRGEDADREAEIHRWLNRYTDNMAQTEESYLDRIRCLEELSRIYPDHLEGRLKLGEFQIMRGDPAAAVATTRQLIVEHPELGRAYALHVEALRREYGDDRARKELQGLLQDVPAIPVARRQQVLQLVLEGFPR